MALCICSLGSGSKGNSIYVSNGRVNYLIDCGLTVEDIKRGLSEIGVSLNQIDGIFITHEHIDHIRSAGILSEAYGIPLYAHENTFLSLGRKFFKRLKNAATFSTFGGFGIGGLDIVPFRNPHDVFTVGYSIADSDSRIVYSTDLGYVTRDLIEISEKADLVMIESNYDTAMLRCGSYPPYLKKRILSASGHLSNDDCTSAIIKMVEKGTKKFVLGHLSEENNLPSLALGSVVTKLTECGAIQEIDYSITVALQRERTPLLRSKDE